MNSSLFLLTTFLAFPGNAMLLEEALKDEFSKVGPITQEVLSAGNKSLQTEAMVLLFSSVDKLCNLLRVHNGAPPAMFLAVLLPSKQKQFSSHADLDGKVLTPEEWAPICRSSRRR